MYMKEGKLVPDKLVVDMLKKEMESIGKQACLMGSRVL